MSAHQPEQRSLPRGMLTIVICVLAVVAGQLAVNQSHWPLLLAVGLGSIGLNWLRRDPLLTLILWLAIAPFLMYTPTPESRMVYWAVHRALPPIAVGLLLINQFARAPSGRRLPPIQLPELAMAAYVVLSLISIWLFNQDPLATAYLFYDRVFVPMCLYLVVRLCTPTSEDVRRLAPVLLVVCLAQAAICATGWSYPDLLPSAWINANRIGQRGTGTLESPSVYTAALIFAGLLLLHTARHTQHKVVRAAYVGTFAVSLLAIFMSFSRASWLSTSMIMGCLLVVYPRAMLRFVGGGLAVGLVAALFASGLLTSQARSAQERLVSDDSQEAAMSRLPVAMASLRMLQDKPLFGWGYENHNRFDWQFQTAVAGYSPTKDHSSHNFYLTLLAEQGLVGFGLYLTPLLWCLLHSRQTARRLPRGRLWGRQLWFVLWMIILHHVVVNSFSNMRVVYGLGLWWITLGFMAHIIWQTSQTKSGSPSRGKVVAV